MIIRSTQINKINRSNLDDFVIRLGDMLRKNHVHTFGKINESQQNYLLEYMIECAQKLSFNTENLIARYSNIFLVLGPGFEDSIDAQWLNEILKKGAVTPDVKMNLFERYTKDKLKRRNKK